VAADAAGQARMAAPREFPFSEKEFEKIAKQLRAVAGIDMPRAKEPLVYSRLAKRIRQLGLRSFADYCKLVEDPNAHEIEHMLVALTTNVTRFFREPHHFEDLKRRVLPPLITRLKNRGRARIWSAGCSSGQEPYSIALTVLEVLPEAKAYDIRILATDINTQVVAEARAGRYPVDQVSSVPEAMRKRYFEADGSGQVRVTDEARALIVFRELNLMGEWPFKGQFDVIFCRNVAIYFDEDVQATLWRRFAERLNPGGRLYIGHSERVGGPAAQLLRTDGVTAYTRPGSVA
jgi:chemotaxis protein methyltransferase CheR